MTTEEDSVKTWEQLSLLPPTDTTVLLEVTLHHLEGHATISVEARTQPGGNLVALQSTPFVPMERVDEEVRTVGRFFTRVLREHSGPF